MSIRGQAVIVGAYEHPRREIPDRTVAQIHREVAVGALADAGLTLADVDAYFCDSMAPGFGPVSMSEYLGPGGPLRRQHRDRRQLVPRCTSGTPPPPSRPASAAWRSSPWPGARAPAAPARAAPLAWRTRRSRASSRSASRARSATTPSPPAATCTSSAPPASSWRGSRSRPRSTPSTTRTPCCRRPSRSTTCSARRWSPIRSTGSTAAWSPTAAAPWWSCTRTSPATSAAPARRCSATARRSSTPTPAASTSPTRRRGGPVRPPSPRRA